jgi:hypothetical protein
MEDCSHSLVVFDRRIGAETCILCNRAACEFYETWCDACAAWQLMLVYIVPGIVACGRCQHTLPANAPRRKEIRWS